MKIEYAIIVKNKTRLELLTERFNTRDQAKFYIERQGGHFEDYVKEHETFHASLQEIQRKLSQLLKNKIVERSFLSSFLFSPNHLIIVVGQDGLVANTAKYSNNVPIVAVNPDKERYDGILLPYTSNDFSFAVEQVLKNKMNVNQVRFAEAKLNDGQRLLAFNDLFIGPSSHVSARYRISYRGSTEEQSSSGIIVSTKAGSTGWLSSIFNMAYGITSTFNHDSPGQPPTLDGNQLLYAVREPFKSIRTQTNICAGIITNNEHIVVESLMPNNGIIFSDGVDADFIKFNSGAIATIGLAKETASLIIP